MKRTLILAGLAAAAISCYGQAAKKYVTPRTADGKPDLQGVYSNASDIPLERPAGLGAKEFYTDAELKQRAEQKAARDAAAANGRNTEVGTTADVHYDLSQFGLGNAYGKVSANNRTSLIVGPEGKVPPTLPAAQKRAADKAAANRGHQFDGPENRGLAERCILWGNEGPPMMPVGYNSDLQIVQGPGYRSEEHTSELQSH